MKIYIITSNKGKIMAAKSVFDKYEIGFKNIDKDYPEIQASTSLEIAKHTAVQAAQDFKKNVLREDHSLYLNALGVPGPYMNYFEKKVSIDNLIKLTNTFKNNTGYFEVATVLAMPKGKVYEFLFKVPFYIKSNIEVPDPRGGWNGAICLGIEKRAFEGRLLTTSLCKGVSSASRILVL